MKTSFLNLDLRNLPKFLFFLILLSYPLFSILVYRGIDINPNYVFGFLCFALLFIRLFEILRTGSNLVIPYYLIFLGLFAIYRMVSQVFLTTQFEEKGILKFIYSDFALLSFVVLLVVENTHFPAKWIKFAIKILGITLFLAAIASVIQISKPLFLINDDFLVSGLSYDRLEDYYGNNNGVADASGTVDRFLEGYRASIYSYINSMSVGIDNLAIFSLLMALHSPKWITTLMWIVAAALVSFLSSSRWIMLNFLIIASQSVWLYKNKLFGALKYIFIGALLIVMFIPVLEFIGFNIQEFVEKRLLSDSASSRFFAFEVFAEVYPDNPIFGTGGVDSSKMTNLIRGRSSRIHVGYLSLFYHYGLVGGLLFLSFMVTLLVRLWQTARVSNYWGGFFALLAFFVANLTLPKFDVFFFGIVLALIFSNHFYKESINNFPLRKNSKIDRVKEF